MLPQYHKYCCSITQIWIPNCFIKHDCVPTSSLLPLPLRFVLFKDIILKILPTSCSSNNYRFQQFWAISTSNTRETLFTRWLAQLLLELKASTLFDFAYSAETEHTSVTILWCKCARFSPAAVAEQAVRKQSAQNKAWVTWHFLTVLQCKCFKLRLEQQGIMRNHSCQRSPVLTVIHVHVFYTTALYGWKWLFWKTSGCLMLPFFHHFVDNVHLTIRSKPKGKKRGLERVLWFRAFHSEPSLWFDELCFFFIFWALNYLFSGGGIEEKIWKTRVWNKTGKK